MLACPGRWATVRRQTAQRTSGSWVTVTGWREEVGLRIASILPVGSSCSLQGPDADHLILRPDAGHGGRSSPYRGERIEPAVGAPPKVGVWIRLGAGPRVTLEPDQVHGRLQLVGLGHAGWKNL